MKKVLIILMITLCAIGGVLSLLGSRGEYVAERYLWRLSKQMEIMSKDTQNTPPARYTEVAKQYRSFIKNFSSSSLVPSAYVSLARLYVVQKDFPKARLVLNEIITKYEKNESVAVKAHYEIAQTYYMEGDIQNTLATYNLILKKYPLTDIGLRVPLLMAIVYADNNDLEWSERSFEKAIKYYNDLIVQYPNSLIEFHALHLLAKCYTASSQWQKALEAMERILIDFSNTNLLHRAKAEELVKGINVIALGNLKDHMLAVNIYDRFIQKNPNHPLSPKLKKVIEGISRFEAETRNLNGEGNDEI